MNILSAFGGGLIVIPILTFLGAIYFGYVGYKASKSNSTTQLPGNSGTLNNTGNVPFYKTGQGIFCIALVLATIGIVIYMYSER